MEKRREISESRSKFDKALASPGLTDEESISSLVKSQILRSTFAGSQGEIEDVVRKRTSEVSNFLDMLRSTPRDHSASLKFHGSKNSDWKLKQDSDQLRVMYREGPPATPFHTLLVEGFADGPIDACLCVEWESPLYKSWFPHFSFPKFEIVSSSSLLKIGTGEEISLVRMKVPWPIADREVILHNFELEFFEENLILVVLNTIPSSEISTMSSKALIKDVTPEAKDVVRIDLVGGLALQKVSPTRSYFRLIGNLDLKLEFLPPSLINFISRQIIGNGHKLYNKAVVSVVGGAETYQKALKGPMYARIREHLYSSDTEPEIFEETDGGFEILTAHSTKEVATENSADRREISEYTNGSTNKTLDSCNASEDATSMISPQVKRALNLVDDAIAILRRLEVSDDSEKSFESADKLKMITREN